MTLCYSVTYYWIFFFFFFFSSRRRHTRYIGDWSSDVCSSDLVSAMDDRLPGCGHRADGALPRADRRGRARGVRPGLEDEGVAEIGRASCRERVESSVGGVGVKRKKRGLSGYLRVRNRIGHTDE